jgi:signal transduction histidine kinase
MRIKPGFVINSLFARIALIIVLGILASQALSLWLQAGERSQAITQARGQHFADQLADAIRVLEATPPLQRATSALALHADTLRIEAIRPDEVSAAMPRGQIQALLASRLGSTREIRTAGGMGMGEGMGRGNMHRGERDPGFSAPAYSGPQTNAAPHAFDIQLLDGQWFRMTASMEAPAPTLPSALILRLVATLLVVTSVVILAARQVSAPLRRLAFAADTLGRDIEIAPLPETGTIETRQAAQAFNRMQARLRHLLNERSRALAAVSHDLRTPLTKLRLRAELVEDGHLREQICTDLDAMAAMLDTTLDYLRSLKDNEKPCLIDINAMLQSICADSGVLGRPVTLEGHANAPFRGRLSALQRAIQNLVDNAAKYGGSARIVVADSGDELTISIQDDGPGIPPEELSRVTEPYYRPDIARTAGTGGVGLGLSIVTDIAALHGGGLWLENRQQGGLQATLKLPRDEDNR